MTKLISLGLSIFLTTVAWGLALPAPVLNEDFPDPAVLLAPDGWYYAYATQTIRDGRDGNGPKIINIQVARSRDLLSWEHLGDALPEKPTWARTTQRLWAPHVYRDEDSSAPRYIMYYSADPDAGGGLCLAVAEANDPRGPFVDRGTPLKCGPTFENIDPMAFKDQRTGDTLLYWGSGFGPIRVQKLAKDLVSFDPGSAAKDLIHPLKDDPRDPDGYERLIEGAWITERDGFYYLFYSGANCCDPDPHYAVMVARSKSPLGPFERLADQPGQRSSVIVAKFGDYLAPGHNSVIAAPDGELAIVYHAIDKRRVYLDHVIQGDRKVRRVLVVEPLRFENGWPMVSR